LNLKVLVFCCRSGVLILKGFCAFVLAGSPLKAMRGAGEPATRNYIHLNPVGVIGGYQTIGKIMSIAVQGFM
jgi:hypothetical protein